MPGHQILLQQVDELRDVLGSYAKEIALDAGYYNARCAKALFERGFLVSLPYKPPRTKEQPPCKRIHFQRVHETLYCCPNGIPFTYRTTTRQGYHEFKPPKNSCVGCPFALKNNQDRVLRISIHQPIYDRLRVIPLSWRGKILSWVSFNLLL